MGECVFCEIARGERSAHKVFEDEHSIAFLDIFPLAEGHVLVVPRRHAPTVESLTEEEACALFKTVWRVNKAVIESTGADATTIGVNNGSAAGQVVPHVHVHVVPRWRGDGSGTIHSVFKSPPRPSESRMREIAERIRSRL